VAAGEEPQKLFGIVAFDRRKLAQESIEIIAVLQIVQQRLGRNPGAVKNEGATHERGIGVNRLRASVIM